MVFFFLRFESERLRAAFFLGPPLEDPDEYEPQSFGPDIGTPGGRLPGRGVIRGGDVLRRRRLGRRAGAGFT